jgi:DHA3 family macrolide efflux protein-like MFS transporter
MLMLKALRHRALKRLWFGQALSSIGDEIYRVGLTWIAVGIIGADTGYLAAAQAAALMILSFIGGRWAEHWDPLRTMIRVDFTRAMIVLIPVVVSYLMPVPLTLLVIVAIVLAALSAFFDPALQTVLPQFSPDTATLRAATGLMATTIRFARMVGPAIVGLLAGFIPPIHFFTMDSISFLMSAGSLRPLQNAHPVSQVQGGAPAHFIFRGDFCRLSLVAQTTRHDLRVVFKSNHGRYLGLSLQSWLRTISATARAE